MNRLRQGAGAIIPRDSADDRALEGRMNLPTTIQFDGMPLRKALDDLRQIHGLNIYVDEQALLERGIGLDRPVTIKLDQIALKMVLNLMLRNLGLTYIIEDGTVQITTPDKTRGKMTLATHYVADLVIPICNYGQLPAAVPGQPTPPLPGANIIPPPPTMYAPPTPTTPPYSLGGGTPTGSGVGGGTQVFGAAAANDGNKWSTSSPTATQERDLIRLITSVLSLRAGATWAARARSTITR